MPRAALPFNERVDCSGDHHLWLGAKKADGTGQVRIGGKVVTAPRAAWELAHGPLPPRARVRGCPDEPACVRLDHLSLDGATVLRPTQSRTAYGTGSKREIRPGVWKLSVRSGTYPDGSPLRINRNVRANSPTAAARELAAFVAEVSRSPAPPTRDIRELTMDAAVERFLTEHLRDEKGREEKTISDYRKLHDRWFSPEIGRRRVREIEEGHLDRLFGRMRKAGLSRSRLNQAKSLYAPFFRWARARKITNRDPMAAFQLPTSTYVPSERTPPEVEELCILLREAVVVIPEVAPILALGAVTGMRRGELVAVRRSRVGWDECRITVDVAVSETKQVKGTKTRRARNVFVDVQSMAMLRHHCDAMDARAAEFGVVAAADAFLFSLAPDCSEPIPPDYVTKRVGILKDHLGIADKKAETVALEDEALRLYRTAPTDRSGMTGPAPKGGLSFRTIGAELGRTERWAAMAVAAAERRETAKTRGWSLNFDGSTLALRKFTSSELLDAGFNISAVAQRQGHGAQVLIKHYSKGRKSADRRAAEHLGSVVHRRSADRGA